MKRIQVLAAILVLVPFAAATIARAQQEIPSLVTHESKTGSQSFDVNKLGKPTFTSTKAGIKAQVWLVSRAEHDRLSGRASGSEPQLDSPGKSSGEGGYTMKKEEKTSMGGSSRYEVAIVVLTDAMKNVPIDNAKADLSLTSPTKKTSEVSLSSMQGHYSGDINLTEKGSYKIGLKITHDGKTTTMTFDTPLSAI